MKLVVVGATLALALSGAGGCDRGREAPATGGEPVASPAGEGTHAPGTAPPEPAALEACPAGFPRRPLESGQHTGFEVDGESRGFHLTLPEGERAHDLLPLLVAFHGTGETGRGFVRRSGLGELAQRGVIVAAPDAAGHGTIWPVWDALRLAEETSPNADLAFVDRLLDCLSARLPVDPERIVVAGHSAGGIFANRVLRARSERLRGGIVASGIFDLTGDPGAGGRLAPLNVLVTWGGDNDVWSGHAGDGTRVADLPFAEQGALASGFYEAAPAVRQMHCRGRELGHVWLRPLNGWMLDVILADPGAAPELPEALREVAACEGNAAALPGPPYPAPSCVTRGPSPCSAFCNVVSRCLFTNATVGPVLRGHLEWIGFTERSCIDCVTLCRQPRSDLAADAAVRDCLGELDERLVCEPGITGALPVLGRIDQCCAAHPESAVCRALCSGIAPTDAVSAFLPSCVEGGG